MKLSAELANQERTVDLEPLDGGRWRISIDGSERLVDARRLGPGSWSILLGDTAITVDIDAGKDGELLCDVRGTVVGVRLVDARERLLEKAKAAAAHAPKGPMAIEAPMPGKLVKLLVKAGDAVVAGQPVAVVEAMKMENEIRSPRAGAVQAVHVTEGQTVEGQEALLTVA